MHVDTFYSSLTSIISEIVANSMDCVSILRLNLYEQWFDIFIIVAGSTSTPFRNPQEIFIGETNSTLFVADSGNNRIQLCQLG